MVFFSHFCATAQPVNFAVPKEELEELLRRKANVEEQIAFVERQIHGLETAYLEETALYGNVVRGFDGYLQNRSTLTQADRKRFKMRESDRLFSMSSTTSAKVRATALFRVPKKCTLFTIPFFC